MNLACLATRSVGVFLGALTYHIKGLGLKTNTSPLGNGPPLPGGREICLMLCGLAAAYALWAFNYSFDWWIYVLVLIGTALADAKGHSGGIIFGSATGTTWRAFFILLATGALSGAATVLALAYEGAYTAAAIAMACFCLKPASYFIGWKIPSTVHDFESGPPIGECIHGASRLAWPLAAFLTHIAMCHAATH